MGKYIDLRDILKKPEPIEEEPTYTVYILHYDNTISKIPHIVNVIQNQFGNWILSNSSRTYIYKDSDVAHVEMRLE